jgi:cyclopropane-fatty-acyl-phospholipid synthase
MSLDGLSASEREPQLGLSAAREQAAPRHSTSRRLLEEALQTAGIRIDGADPWDIHVNDAHFYDRVLADGSLGLGETYVEGWWDCEQIDEAIRKIMDARLERHFARRWHISLSAMKVLRAKILNLQRPKKAAEVANVHYDLDVELFRYMLGPTMVYSCAYWKDAANLDRAQEDKLDLICRKLGVRGSDSILDVGCGWGGLLKYSSARFGCRATGITISAKQCAYAIDYCEGLPVRVLLGDYRDTRLGSESRFDKIACIGMLEHVGRKNYRTFIKIIDNLLAENGLFLLQTVGRCIGATDPWLDKYIFPNGMLPSAAEIAKAIEGLFVIEDWHCFGMDYDRTLMAWHANFEAYADSHGSTFPKGFHRLWRYYLLSCAGSFRACRGPQLWQILLSKGNLKGGYRSPR